MGPDNGNPITPGGELLLDAASKQRRQMMQAEQSLARTFVHTWHFSEAEVAHRLLVDVATLHRMLGLSGEMDPGCAQYRHGGCVGWVQHPVGGLFGGGGGGGRPRRPVSF